VAVDEREVRHGDVSSSGEEREGGGSKRVVRADDIEHDANLDGERESLKEYSPKRARANVNVVCGRMTRLSVKRQPTIPLAK